MRAIFLILFVSSLLVACDESPEAAYERGYEDGIDDVCQEINRISSDVYSRLRSERVCF